MYIIFQSPLQHFDLTLLDHLLGYPNFPKQKFLTLSNQYFRIVNIIIQISQIFEWIFKIPPLSSSRLFGKSQILLLYDMIRTVYYLCIGFKSNTVSLWKILYFYVTNQLSCHLTTEIKYYFWLLFQLLDLWYCQGLEQCQLGFYFNKLLINYFNFILTFFQSWQKSVIPIQVLLKLFPWILS
jgi:hypothetical protein